MDTKQQILDATFHLFAEKGYHTSMSDISKKVGIKVPSIYSHFKSKDEIIFTVMEREIKSFFEKIRTEVAVICALEEDCGTRLKNIFYSVISYFEYEKLRSWRNISLIYQKELREKCRELYIKEESHTTQLLKTIYDEGIKRSQIKADHHGSHTLFYLTMMQGYFELVLIYHESNIDLEQYKNKIWLTYWESIRV